MSQSAVIFIDKATPATLLEFKDVLSNNILSIAESWSIEFRTYRSQVKLKASHESVGKSAEPEDDSKVMYSVYFPHQQSTIVVKNGIGTLTTNDTRDSQDLLDSSSSQWYPDSLDTIINNKLSNIWSQRQIVKGDTGETFNLMTNNCTIRCCNLFSSFGFKGLIIEVRRKQDGKSDTEDSAVEFEAELTNVITLLKNIGIEQYKLSKDALNSTKNSTDGTSLCNLAYQYTQVLK